jgi:hypothetical protein
VAAGRLYADLHRNSADRQCRKAGIPHGDFERRPLESRHSELVEHEILLLRTEFRNDLNRFAVPQEPGFYGLWVIGALPCHCHARCKQPHPRLGQGKMAAEGNSHPGASGRRDNLNDAASRLFRSRHLPGNADLHIVDQQCGSIGRKPVYKCRGYRHWRVP